MAKKGLVLAALLALAVGHTAAQQDARSALQAAAQAIGAGTLKTIQYSGTGWTAFVGQSFSLTTGDWPRFEVPTYTRTIDYDAKSLREEYTRRQGNFPPQGGGGTPLQGEPRTIALLSGNYAWNLQGEMPVAQTRPYLDGTPVNELRQLEIILTPHGFVKAAMAATNAKAHSMAIVGSSNDDLTGNARKVTIVSFTALGKYKVNGTINDQNLVELVTTWIPNPVYGDMLYEMRYTEYKDYGGIKFPGVLHVHQGDPVLNPAHNIQEIRVTSVQPNAPAPPIAVPDVVRQATAPPSRVETQKLADGVWLLGGGSHNSMAVDFKDWVAVIEAPLNEDRSLAVIDAVTKLIPAKPIRYVVNTHHHFDHSGGLRTYLSQGTTIVTHQMNRDFYQNVMFSPAPRALQPDRLAMFYPMYVTSRRPMRIETVDQQYVLTDGLRILELHPVQGLQHAQGMLVAYLPKERLLLNADLYSPPAQGAATPAMPSAAARSLAQTIQRLKLDVAQHVPVHGRVGTHDEFMKIMSAKTE
jgi:glyoxylase-like metal-dependent hydrolase (beta-lactamase superfamily II)